MNNSYLPLYRVILSLDKARMQAGILLRRYGPVVGRALRAGERLAIGDLAPVSVGSLAARLSMPTAYPGVMTS